MGPYLPFIAVKHIATDHLTDHIVEPIKGPNSGFPRMRILFVSPYTPNPIRVRPFQFLRALAGRHSILLGTVWSTQSECADLDYLRTLGIEVVDQYLPPLHSWVNSLAAVPTTMPLQAAFCWHPGLAKRLLQLAQELRPDVIHVEHLRGARYGLYLKRRLAAAGQPLPIVWDSVDCITHLFRQAASQSRSRKGRWLTRFELARTSRFERRMIGEFDSTVVTSRTDQAELSKLLEDGSHKIHVVPNGVDLDYFTPGRERRQPATLVLTGKMSYHANVTAAIYLVREIMPLVWAQRPDVEVWLVGKDPTREVLALADPGGNGSRRVLVTGAVPDIRAYLRRATIAVAPVPYGAGIQNKVLEAMACGTPVIASEQAVSALQAQAGRDLLVAQDPPAFAQSILHLLNSPLERASLARAGRSYVERHHAWAFCVAHLEQIYGKVIHTATAAERLAS